MGGQTCVLHSSMLHSSMLQVSISHSQHLEHYIFVCVHLKACTGVHHWFFGLFLIGFLNGLVHRGLLQPGHVEGNSPVFIFGIHEWPHLKQR
jgi:hypothetical protein